MFKYCAKDANRLRKAIYVQVDVSACVQYRTKNVRNRTHNTWILYVSLPAGRINRNLAGQSPAGEVKGVREVIILLRSIRS